MSQTVMCDPNAKTVVVNESEDLVTMATDDEDEYHECLNIIHENMASKNQTKLEERSVEAEGLTIEQSQQSNPLVKNMTEPAPSTINMTRVGKEQTNKYFRDESLHPSAFEGENAGEIYSSQQHCQINNNAEQDESDISKTKDNQEVRRCTIYMSGLKCHKGDYCEKSHRFPREDKVLCEYFDGEGCDRPASECWYWHPGTSIKYVPDDNAPVIVQSMGGIMKYLKEEIGKNPNKY